MLNVACSYTFYAYAIPFFSALSSFEPTCTFSNTAAPTTLSDNRTVELFVVMAFGTLLKLSLAVLS